MIYTAWSDQRNYQRAINRTANGERSLQKVSVRSHVKTLLLLKRSTGIWKRSLLNFMRMGTDVFILTTCGDRHLLPSTPLLPHGNLHTPSLTSVAWMTALFSPRPLGKHGIKKCFGAWTSRLETAASCDCSLTYLLHGAEYFLRS
jgi:hypothetical protein